MNAIRKTVLPASLVAAAPAVAGADLLADENGMTHTLAKGAPGKRASSSNRTRISPPGTGR